MKEKLKLIPELPGCYLMKNKYNIIIYVGKAKNLKKRVNSYFNKIHTGKTGILVSEIVDFEIIVAGSELEAFILELNLIKKYDPKYNILLRDDKSYPYIEYISKPYPILKVSRYLHIKKKDNKIIFGPYPNAYAARRIVKLINRLYPLKKCNTMPKNVCLYYHINECLGYCEKKVDQEKLMAMETEILAFLRGNDKIIKDKIKNKIDFFIKELNFEQASELKNELEYIEVINEKQKVELHDYINRDVANYYFNNGYISMTIMFIRNGKLVGNFNDIFYVISDKIDEINYYLLKFYETHEIPKEILVSNDFNTDVLSELLKTKVIIPKIGEKKKIIEMAELNAKISLENKIKLITNNEDKMFKANNDLKDLLNLEKLERIDLFDNSNLFGDYTVSSMVVFKNGKECKKEYRKYKISIDKNDDFNAMKEVIYRRYYKMLLEKTERPDLIIVDGGINQINACKQVLDELKLNIKVTGLKKNDTHKTNDLVDGDTYQILNVKDNGNLFNYLTKMQDEVHRFTINYHRTLRSKGAIKSILDDVKGLGSVRKKKLMQTFKTINGIKNASDDELLKVIPKNVLENLRNSLK